MLATSQVAPAYDHAGITAMAAANLLLEQTLRRLWGWGSGVRGLRISCWGFRLRVFVWALFQGREGFARLTLALARALALRVSAASGCPGLQYPGTRCYTP